MTTTGIVIVCRNYVQLRVTNTSDMCLELSDMSLTVNSDSIELLSFNGTIGNMLVSIECVLQNLVHFVCVRIEAVPGRVDADRCLKDRLSSFSYALFYLHCS
jgi:hypothetical protein